MYAVVHWTGIAALAIWVGFIVLSNI